MKNISAFRRAFHSIVLCAGVFLLHALTVHAAGPTPPPIPTQLVAIGVTPNQVNLRWAAGTDHVDVAGYNVYRDGVKVGSPTGTGWSSPTGTATAYSDTSLAPGTIYTYTVRAFNSAGDLSAASATAIASTLPAMAIPNPGYIQPFYRCVTNYYVAKTGSDATGNGSSAGPWLTITAAINFLTKKGSTHGGVCVNVASGTYTESVNGGALSGSSDSPKGYFVLRSTTPHGAIIQLPAGSSDYTNGIMFTNASYIVIDGFDLIGSNSPPDTDGSGIVVMGNAGGSSTTYCPSTSRSHHIRIFNNISHGWGGSGIGTTCSDYYDVEGNVVYGTSNTSIWGVSAINQYEPLALDSNSWSTSTMDSASAQFHYIIRNNVAFNNAEVNIGPNTHYDGNGITLDTFNLYPTNGYSPYLQKTLVENNLSFDNGGGGIVTGGSGASYVTIRNNTTFSNFLDAQNPAKGGGEISVAGFVSSHDNVIVNNIAVANPTANSKNAAFIDASFGGSSASNKNDIWLNNLSFDGIAGQPSVLLSNTTATIDAASGNLLGANPMLSNSSSGDFTLLAASPAIGAGTNVYGLALTDLNGNSRTNSGKVDMGAYERQPGAGSGVPTRALTQNAPSSVNATTNDDRKGAASLAPTPPMGWNSWDSWGSTITEAEFRETVQWFHRHLQPLGWQYMVIDAGWYAQHPENSGSQYLSSLVISADGRYMPAANRFPSSADGRGLKPLADYVHSLGLKFGIHIMHGVPREAVDKNPGIANSDFHLSDAANKDDKCKWNSENYGIRSNAAGQAYYDSIAQLYAGWGVDFLKVDGLEYPHNADEIHMLDTALRKTGRPIVLSVSSYPTPLDESGDLREHAQLWRISDDVWDLWSKPSDAPRFPQSLLDQFQRLAEWAPYAESNHWPDADMLPIGYLGPRTPVGMPRDSHLTHDEERTMLTLWSIARSPLILGSDLLKMDRFTESLLTNPEIIDVNQHSTKNHPLIQRGDTVVWVANSAAGSKVGSAHYVAVFNLANTTRTIVYTWLDLALPPGTYTIRDLWKRKNVSQRDRLEVTLAPHASAIYRVGQP